MRTIFILGLCRTGKSTICSYIFNIIREREDRQRIVFCDDLDAENRERTHRLWSAVLSESLEKVYESATSKMRSVESDWLRYGTFVRYHEHTHTAFKKLWNVANSQFSEKVNHINLHTTSTTRAFRSLCSYSCMLWNGAAALRQMREQIDGNYRFREGFQLQNRIASISCKWRNRFLELIHICDTVFLLKRPSTVQTALALC